jgi:hypothetical protein
MVTSALPATRNIPILSKNQRAWWPVTFLNCLTVWFMGEKLYMICQHWVAVVSFISRSQLRWLSSVLSWCNIPQSNTLICLTPIWSSSAGNSWRKFQFKCCEERVRCRPPLWSSGQSSCLQIQRPGFGSRRYQIFWEVVGLELLEIKSSGSDLENQDYDRRDWSRWHHGTLYPQQLTLTLSTSGDRSFYIVRLWAQAMEFSFSFLVLRVFCRQTIHNLVNKLRSAALLTHKEQKHKRWVLTEEKLDDIGTILEHKRRMERQSLMQEGQHSCWSLDRKKRIIRAMQVCDPASKVHLYSWLQQSVVEGKIGLQLAFFSDEVWYRLSGIHECAKQLSRNRV